MCKENQGCKDCFKAQKELNDLLIQTTIDAQEKANETGAKVAIIQEGRTYRYELITGSEPIGTIKVVTKV
jgi:hypothetical protein